MACGNMESQFHLVGLLSVLIAGVSAQYFGNYYCRPGRDVAVHLFEWKWTDIEKECAWLAEHNYCAVQVKHRIPSLFSVY